MPLDLDYINYLADKWRYHLLEKENPSFLENREEYVNRRRMYADVLDMVDEMKNETKVGVMLYKTLWKIHSFKPAQEERDAFKEYKRK